MKWVIKVGEVGEVLVAREVPEIGKFTVAAP
jgi:hypothetical protein